MLGALILMLLAMPAMAEITQGDYSGTAPVARGESGGVDMQTPVLDGSAFTNYDTIFVPGCAANIESEQWGVYSAMPSVGVYPVTLNAGTSSHAWIDCPVPSYESKTGGIRPKVRYVGLYYQTLYGNTVVIDRVEVRNGNERILDKFYNPPIYSSTYTVLIIDLGGWYSFNRGLSLCVHAKNTNPNYANTINIGGYAARFEW